uniref:Transmembrane protein 25 n=1 Tax=Pelusios castaneus TaxID=367368 RepID=A0A8C8VK34_9SAUR
PTLPPKPAAVTAAPSGRLGEPDPKINGQSLLVSTLQEDESRDFTCQAGSWKAVPMLTWYLNGKKQETNSSTVLTTLAEAFEQSSSTFTVTAQRADRELNCSLMDPASGKTSNASVLLNVQFKPEIMKMNAKYQEAKDPGLFMVLFVLVRANPPASITWMDQDGHIMVNTSDFLILDAKSYPWLTNHTVQVQLSSVAKNFSFTAANNVGITNSSIPEPPTRPPGLGDSNNLKLNSMRLRRENMSLPSNLQLNDFTQAAKAWAGSAAGLLSWGFFCLSGFIRFPMVGHIYKVSSMSSDEIWL